MNRWKYWTIVIAFAATTAACSDGGPLGPGRTAEPFAGAEPASRACEPETNGDPRIQIPDEDNGSTGGAPNGCAEDQRLDADPRIHVQGD